MRFPLPTAPTLSYRTGGRRFGAPRGSRRRHAACDLIARDGTDVLSVDSGVLTRGPYLFYHGVYAIEVRDPHFIVRYCEIRRTLPSGVAVGTAVREGQAIAHVGRMHRDSMLHFEMYSGTATGSLTQRRNAPYQRRSDLMDPTPWLDLWASGAPVGVVIYHDASGQEVRREPVEGTVITAGSP